MHFLLDDVLHWEKKYRIRFINSISGYKSVHLIGTENSKGQTNLAIFNSIVHVGADPPLVGMIMRPITVPRHTYSNLVANQCYTINHVHKSFLKKAHFTSVDFPEDESEFDACGLTVERLDGFSAPFVAESKIKMGIKLREDILISSNGTRLIVGEIQHILIDDEVIEADGQLDLERAHDVCVTGLNQYSSVSKWKKFDAAKLESLPDFKRKERPDQIVFDEETQSYNASLLAYGTSVSAPQITPAGMTSWKNSSVGSFNHAFNTKIESLKATYQQLLDEYHINEMVYGAKINFEPIIGQVYHLYVDNNQDERFLSLVPPNTWKKQHIGSFKLNPERIWERVPNPPGHSVQTTR